MIRGISRNLFKPVTRGVQQRFHVKQLPISIASIRHYSITDTTGHNIEDKIDQITSNQYSQISQHYLDTLNDHLEVLSETFPQIDCELNMGILTIDVPPHGSYVINKQPPNKQIWLSSPVSGPKRYDLIGGKWVTLRDGTELTQLLQNELGKMLEYEVEFDVEN